MSSHDTKRSIEAHKKWLGYLQPDGLVVSPAALVDKGHYFDQAQRERQLEFIEHLESFQTHNENEGTVEILDFKSLATDFLGLPIQEWVDSANLAESCTVPLKESSETLAPTAALNWPRGKELTEEDPPYQLLILEHTVENNGQLLDFDTPYEVIENTWSTNATRRMERLLRETEVPIGLLVSPTHLRLVYAPVGENAGSLTFQFADMLSTMGRPILGAFDLLFNIEMLFIGEESQQLPALLKHSREMQANVSIELAHQVLDGLYDLVRGTQAADARSNGRLLRHLLATNPNLIYEGQLNVLMRLVFLLFAEDRGLMPNSGLYNQYYSVHALYERLRQDHALHHDTMDDRYGAWAQLLALFRLIFHGHRHRDLKLPARYGYLFDPDRFPFLEGRVTNPETQEEEDLNLPLIPDGTLFRLLQGLLFLDGERISYRTLDVEQIGSVYETMMGFGLVQAEGQTIAIRPVKKHGAAANLNLDHLLTLDKKERAKYYTEVSGRKIFTGNRRKEFDEASNTSELLAVFQGPTANSNLIARNATPEICPPRSILLEPTDARRKSGSHYTPRKLTEPIVRKAFEPILARLGDKPFPKEILDLKVCDPAVGSGAFLVEACRQLGDELVKAWAAHGGKPVIPPDEDEVLHARRLVAQRCLYGVDRNPMAADLAKLSLWLATLAKDHPFTFLAHAIRSGDSLVGLSRKQILAFHWDLKHPSAQQRIFGQDQLEKRIKSALAYRQEILDAGDLVLPEMKAAQLRLAEDEVDKVRRAGDLAVLGFFSGSKPKERQEARDQLLERWLKATDQTGSEESLREGIALKKEVHKARETEHPILPFHWEIEFPEVFISRKQGFDTFIGNPPYLGGKLLSETQGQNYPEWMKRTLEEAQKNADLAAHFFRRTFDLLSEGGTIGFVTTNSIHQGDTRESGLRWICNHGGEIYSAIKRKRWPGEATVVVSIVNLIKGKCKTVRQIDEKDVPFITAYLFHQGSNESPSRLKSNLSKCSQGTITLGLGFVFDDRDTKGQTSPLSEMDRVISTNPSNQEFILPFLGGSEVNTSPTHEAHRYIIDLSALEEQDARQQPELWEILEQRVKPDRLTGAKEARNYPFWKFWRPRPELYDAVSDLPFALVTNCGASPYLSIASTPTNQIWAHSLCVFAYSDWRSYAILQSPCHETWARFFSSSLEDRLRYTATDCFETFPFPEEWESDARLMEIGREYNDCRAELMVRNDEGLTKTYNRFHDPGETSPDIHKLRELHAAMDRAVLDAYGWTDVPTDCEFIPDFTEEDDDGNEIPKNIRYRWPDEVRDDVLARLLALNAERYKQEVNAGLHAKGKKKAAKKSTRKTAKKAAKKKADLPDLAFVAELNLPDWATTIPGFSYPLPSTPRPEPINSLSYYQVLIPMMVQEAGGSLPLDVLHEAIARLEDREATLTLCDSVTPATSKKWLKIFKEQVGPDAFGSALADLCEAANSIRLVGTQDDLQLRLVEQLPAPFEWHRLDAQLLLTAEARAEQNEEHSRETPAEIVEKILPFIKSA